jgi:hypothetical protein
LRIEFLLRPLTPDHLPSRAIFWHQPFAHCARHAPGTPGAATSVMKPIGEFDVHAGSSAAQSDHTSFTRFIA